MGGLNPVEWFAWIYGKFFHGHEAAGGLIIFVLWGCLGLLLWVRGVDKYKEQHPTAKLAEDALALSDKIDALSRQWKTNYTAATSRALSKATNGETPDYNLETKPVTWRAVDEYRHHYKTDAIELREKLLRSLPPGSRDDSMNAVFGDFPSNEAEAMSMDMVARELKRIGMLARDKGD